MHATLADPHTERLWLLWHYRLGDGSSNGGKFLDQLLLDIGNADILLHMG